MLDPADTTKAGNHHPESASFKKCIWEMAENMMGKDDLHSASNAAQHLVEVEVCTLCKKQNFLTCTESNRNDCDLVSTLVPK